MNEEAEAASSDIGTQAGPSVTQVVVSQLICWSCHSSVVILILLHTLGTFANDPLTALWRECSLLAEQVNRASVK